MQQNEALDLLKLGKNVFLTGAAGTGKTYLLNQYIRYLKNHQVSVAITASTGIAATHIQGTTIHSWSGIGIKEDLSEHDFDQLEKNKRVKSNYKKTKVLIIDEVSMLHYYQLDMLDCIARKLRKNEQPFGGLQVIVCGDFFQLPPVSSGFSKAQSYFAFDAKAWKEGEFHICYLEEQFRQKNDPLLDVLNDIRSGTAGEQTKVPLRTRYKKEPEGMTKATKLYSKNINVDAINEQELANLTGEIKTFQMRSEGFSALADSLKNSCLAPCVLQLKIGAEVMFVKNDPFFRYVNGTRGVVVGFDKYASWPYVKTYQDKTILVSPEDWNYEEQGLIRATITQIPLRLGWAITIHKSQGMTLDTAEMDLGDAFEPGMGYVALSRVRSLNGLKLMNLNEMALKVSPKVLQNDVVFKEYSRQNVQLLQSLVDEEKIKIQQAILTNRFEGKAIDDEATDFPELLVKKRRIATKVKKSKPTPTHLLTLALFKEDPCLKSIAEKRGLTVGTVISHLGKIKSLKLLSKAQLEPLKAFIPKKDFDVIFSELKQSKDGKIKVIYDKYEGRYSYNSIQIVQLFVHF